MSVSTKSRRIHEEPLKLRNAKFLTLLICFCYAYRGETVDIGNGTTGIFGEEEFVLDGQCFFHYFAHGSNLLEERIRIQNPEARFVTVGVLHDYTLGFFGHSKRWHGGVATVEPHPGRSVWGCVWRIPCSLAEELDRQEGRAYRRSTVPIVVVVSEDGRQPTIVPCQTYEFRVLDEANRHLPSPHYKEVIVVGAREHGLPANYIAERLIAGIETNGYEGVVEYMIRAIEHLNNRRSVQ